MAFPKSTSPHPLKHWESWAAALAVVAFIAMVVVLLHAATAIDGPGRPETLGQHIADLGWFFLRFILL